MEKYQMNTLLFKTISFLYMVISFGILTQAQTGIIINEFSQGPSGTTSDWIELVVTANNTNIQGVYYDDDNTLATGSIGKEYSVQLSKTLADFQSVNKGSIIVIYRAPKDSTLPADDTDFADGKIVIPETDTTFLEPGGNGLLLKANRDEFGIFVDNGDTSVVVGIHGIAWGGETGNASLYLTGWGYTEIDSVKAGQSAYFGEGDPSLITIATNWTIQNSSLATPGTLNGGNNNALPVELVSFSAVPKENEVILNWRTATEVNNYGFEIERKVNSQNWHSLGFVEGHGNSNSPKEYSFSDNDVDIAGVYTYRLKQIDNDGSYEYSKTIEVNLSTPNKIELKQNYPNPFNPSTAINFTLPDNEFVSLKVFNMLGKEVETIYEGILEAGVYTYNFNAEGLPSGIYVYKLSTKNYVQAKKMLLLK